VSGGLAGFVNVRVTHTSFVGTVKGQSFSPASLVGAVQGKFHETSWRASGVGFVPPSLSDKGKSRRILKFRWLRSTPRANRGGQGVRRASTCGRSVGSLLGASALIDDVQGHQEANEAVRLYRF
jgi:hypothetical protein